MPTRGQERKIEREGVEVDFLAAFKRLMPNLYGVIMGRAAVHAYRLNIYQRDSGDWLVVVSAYAPDDGRPIVAFGSGVDVNRALMNADKTIAGGGWKEDKRRTNVLQVGVSTPHSGGVGAEGSWMAGRQPVLKDGDKKAG